MRNTERAIISMAIALMFVMAGAVSMVAGQEPGQAQQQEPTSIQGELVEVDTENRMIVVRTTAETPMHFQYTDETEVAGAQESIAGLATERDARVTVYFTEEADVRTATKIEVHPEE